MRSTLSWIGLAIVVGGVTALVLADVFTDMGSPRGDQIVTLVSVIALLIVIGGGAIGAYSGRGTMLLQHIAIWLGLIALFALIYNYRAMLGFNF